MGDAMIYVDHNGRERDQRPHLSGQTCAESGCNKPAGTPWGPHWCPEHDTERIQRINARFDALRSRLFQEARRG